MRRSSIFLGFIALSLVFVPLPAAQQPINPLVNITYPVSMGIASYGVYNYSGRLVPYTIDTNTVIGYANVIAMSVSGANYSISNYTTGIAYNSSPYGSSIQLNVLLNAINDNGINETYWLQGVAVFNTSNHTVYFDDEIWNFTTYNGTIINGSIVGNGFPLIVNSTVNIYDYETNAIYYQLPFAFFITISFRNTSYGLQPAFTYQILNGTSSSGPIAYDTPTILGAYHGANILINPFQLAGGISPYDAEFVLGGSGNGTTANFTSLDALLGMWYLKNGIITFFPSVYDFGSDTAEGAFNANVTLRNGFAEVKTAPPQFRVLSNDFAPVLPSQYAANATANTPVAANATEHCPALYWYNSTASACQPQTISPACPPNYPNSPIYYTCSGTTVPPSICPSGYGFNQTKSQCILGAVTPPAAGTAEYSYLIYVAATVIIVLIVAEVLERMHKRSLSK